MKLKQLIMAIVNRGRPEGCKNKSGFWVTHGTTWTETTSSKTIPKNHPILKFTAGKRISLTPQSGYSYKVIAYNRKGKPLPNQKFVTVKFDQSKAPKRWKPRDGENYYWVSAAGGYCELTWGGDSTDKACFKFGNCFTTKKLAGQASRKVKELLLSLPHE